MQFLYVEMKASPFLLKVRRLYRKSSREDCFGNRKGEKKYQTRRRCGASTQKFWGLGNFLKVTKVLFVYLSVAFLQNRLTNGEKLAMIGKVCGKFRSTKKL